METLYKGYKYEIFVFINHNNLWRFIDIKNLSFKQVYKLKNCLDITFKLSTIKTRLIGQLIYFLNF